MRYPNFREERKLWKRGYKNVLGLDEAGRGPLAGPVVACALMIDKSFPLRKTYLSEVKDSKKLSTKKREELYNILTSHPKIKWGIGRVSEKTIDKINIFQAAKLAMERAVAKLKSKPDFLILDGNFRINLPFPQKSIIRADEKVFSCSAASIIAKVARDRIMLRQAEKYPQYGFDKHKGYPTHLHAKMLNKYGRCAIHRNSFHYGRTKAKAY